MFQWYFHGGSDLPLEIAFSSSSSSFSSSFISPFTPALCWEEWDERGRCFTFFRPHRKQFHRMSCSSEHAQTQLWRQPSKNTHAHTPTASILSFSFLPPQHGLSWHHFPDVSVPWQADLPLVFPGIFFLDKTVVCDEFYLKYFNKDLTDQLRKSRWNVAFRHH